MDEMVYDALVDLKQSIDRQNELQQNMAGAIRELTEMLGHAIDALKELTEELSSDEED